MKLLLTKAERRDYIEAFGRVDPWVRENVLGLPPLPEPEFVVDVCRDGTVVPSKVKAKR